MVGFPTSAPRSSDCGSGSACDAIRHGTCALRPPTICVFLRTMMRHAPELSRRERQIMDVLFRRGSATAAEIEQSIPDAPSYSGVRTILRVLERKGHVVHESRGTQYVYRPATSRSSASKSAVKHLIATFFEDRPARALSAILSSDDLRLSSEEAAELLTRIEKARKRRS